MEIKTFGVIGSGQMGNGIAQVAAASGLDVVMSDIKEEMGITILLVEHNMHFVQQVSDHLMAMDFGQVIAQGPPADVLNHPEVMQAYLGEECVAAQG